MEVHRSALKHGIGEEEILHVSRHVVVAVELEPDADPPKVLLIGPDRSGNLVELIAIELEDDRLLVIHAIPLRPAFQKWLEIRGADENE